MNKNWVELINKNPRPVNGYLLLVLCHWSLVICHWSLGVGILFFGTVRGHQFFIFDKHQKHLTPSEMASRFHGAGTKRGKEDEKTERGK